jgi:hypothetical protein
MVTLRVNCEKARVREYAGLEKFLVLVKILGLALGRALELDATLTSNACLLKGIHLLISLGQFLTILCRRPNDDDC